MVRFLDPDDGGVLLAGTDVRDLAQHDVRRRISLDGQDAYLFATSIRENVRLARPDADDAAVEEALRRARLGDVDVAAPARVGHARRRGRRGRLRRRAPPARARPGAARRLSRAGPGRTDRARRPPDGGGADPRTSSAPPRDRTVLLITHREEEARPHPPGRPAAARPDHPGLNSNGMTTPRRPARSIGGRPPRVERPQRRHPGDQRTKARRTPGRTA